MTHNQAKRLVSEWLDSRAIPYGKLTAKTVNMSDLARATPLFVTVNGWQPRPEAEDLARFAVDHGFRVQFRGEGFIS